MDKFWMVWGPNMKQNTPTRQHKIKEAACLEAERLAQKEQSAFFVLEGIRCYRPQNPPVVWEYLN